MNEASQQLHHFRTSHVEDGGPGIVTIVEEETYYDRPGPTLAEDLSDLAAEAKDYAQAELAYQKTRASYAAGEAVRVVIFGAAALVLAFFGLMAFVVGTVIALGPLLTPWGAMASVTFVLLIAAALCARSVMARVRRITSVISEKNA